jgi:hypothetical protein
MILSSESTSSSGKPSWNTSTISAKAFGLLLGLVVVGCTNVSHVYLTNDLTTGSTRAEAISAMGSEPTRKMASAKMDVLVYYLHASVFDLVFSPQKAPFVGFYPLLRTGQEFWVVLDRARDKVVAFGYAENFSNSLKDLDKL